MVLLSVSSLVSQFSRGFGVMLRFCALPAHSNWSMMASVSMLGGIGFGENDFHTYAVVRRAAILHQADLLLRCQASVLYAGSVLS